MDGSVSLSRLKFLKRKDSLFLPSYFTESSATLPQLQEILTLEAEDRSESQISTLDGVHETFEVLWGNPGWDQ